MERYLTSLIIREMQIKTTMRHHITLVMMLLSKNKNKENKCWQRRGGIGNLYTIGGNVKWCRYYKNIMVVP